MHGWIIIDKPLGLGSTQGVSAVKRALREGGYPKVKVGHGGTLDPLATGVLPIALGEATKLAGRMLDASKIYDFTISFGTETDGLDAEGAVVATSDVRPTLAEVEAILPRFTGPIAQIPPAYSAIKIDGKRAYDRARAGEVVEMKAREVEVYSLQFLPGTGRGTARVAGAGGGSPPAQQALDNADSPLHQPAAGPPPRPGEELGDITLTAHVSKGTYIRSLARDISHALGTVGHVTMLRRTKAGPFGLDRAISLDILENHAKARTLEDICLPLEAGLDDIPALVLTPDLARLIRQGRVLDGIAADEGLHCAWDEHGPVALVNVEDGNVRVVRGFNL
ncbi:tRNA pseudouridine(55) synthase TruB [Pseudonocardia sp. TMWB2A]|uniref:tRNA pseudouridine(55) synthase TruB n=1 Tax=Pseudonocardia sp. TMWB2A TaxID=687430 RepID=UPI00307F541B